MNCKENNKAEICKEILDWINGKPIIFRSTQEFAKPLENKEYYSLEQKGKIKIGSKEYSTQLFYNSTIEEKQFRGKLIFQVPDKFKSLKGVPISIDIKGKK